MNKKIIKVISILQIVLAIVAYFSITYHFNNDKSIFGLLANTDFVATMLRLSIYIVPGIHLLSGLYGLVFIDKKILLIISVVETISSALSFTFIGKSEYMLVLSIISIVLALIYLINVTLMKNE